MPKRSSSTAIETPSKRSVQYTMSDLIALVRDQPLLWDMAHETYRNSTNRKEAWHKIAHRLDKDFENSDKSEQKLIVLAIIKRWKGVRDSFYHSYRRNQQRPYIYEKELQFLLNLRNDLQNKKSKVLRTTSISSEISDSESDFVDNSGQNTNLAEDQNTNASACPPNGEINPTRHEPSKKLDDPGLKAEGSTFPSICHQHQLLSSNAVKIHAPIDEDQAFFDSIKPAVRSLNENQKFDFRIEVMRLLKRMKEGLLN